MLLFPLSTPGRVFRVQTQTFVIKFARGPAIGSLEILMNRKLKAFTYVAFHREG